MRGTCIRFKRGKVSEGGGNEGFRKENLAFSLMPRVWGSRESTSVMGGREGGMGGRQGGGRRLSEPPDEVAQLPLQPGPGAVLFLSYCDNHHLRDHKILLKIFMNIARKDGA